MTLDGSVGDTWSQYMARGDYYDDYIQRAQLENVY